VGSDQGDVIRYGGMNQLLLRPEADITLSNVLAFVPAVLMAWALRFLWGYALALLAFWATRADALLALQDALVFLLAGQVAPTSLLPGVLQKVSVVLPFRYMVGLPVEVLLGQLGTVYHSSAWPFSPDSSSAPVCVAMPVPRAR
jgi:ABC-type uncharacterized transport system permease subunit